MNSSVCRPAFRRCSASFTTSRSRGTPSLTALKGTKEDPLEAAITLAEEEAEYAGAGVLVTGSVITVGEARLLLGRR